MIPNRKDRPVSGKRLLIQSIPSEEETRWIRSNENSRRQRFLKGLRPAKPELMAHVLPEIDKDRPKGTMAFVVPASHIKRFIEKLVRGTIYVTERRYVEEHQEITVSLMRTEDAAPVTQIAEDFGELYERGPGIRIRKAVAEDGRTNALLVFDIWGQYRFHGMVMDRAPIQ